MRPRSLPYNLPTSMKAAQNGHYGRTGRDWQARPNHFNPRRPHDKALPFPLF
jgi:hypothetical protein